MKTLLFLFFCIISMPLRSEEVYYEVIDSGGVFDFYPEMQWVDKAEEEYKKILKNMSETELEVFNAANGDVGRLLVDMTPIKPWLAMDVAGYPVVIKKSDVKQVSISHFDRFNAEIKSRSGNYFGFNLGVTSFNEAVDFLKTNNSAFDHRYVYKNNTRLKMIKVDSYNKFPKLNQFSPNKSYIHIYDDKVYALELTWMKGDLIRRVKDALSNKYNRKLRLNFDSKNHKSYWWNGNTAVELEEIYNGKSSYPIGFTLKYYHIANNKQANNLKHQIDVNERLTSERNELVEFSNQL